MISLRKSASFNNSRSNDFIGPCIWLKNPIWHYAVVEVVDCVEVVDAVLEVVDCVEVVDAVLDDELVVDAVLDVDDVLLVVVVVG